MFSCANCEIFKNIYFEKHLRTAASDYSFTLVIICLFLAIFLGCEENVIEIRLCNPMTYVFKGHAMSNCMVKFNVSILNRLKIYKF